MKKLLALFLALMCVVTALTACGGDSDNKADESSADTAKADAEATKALPGTWLGEYMGYVFESDGTLYSTNANGDKDDWKMSWKVEGGKLVMSIENKPTNYDYKLNGDTLTITMDGKDVEFKKQTESKDESKPVEVKAPTAEELVGTWVNVEEDVGFCFESDGKCYLTDVEGEKLNELCTWSLDGNKLTFDEGGTTSSGKVGISGSTLYFYDENGSVSIEYTKK